MSSIRALIPKDAAQIAALHRVGFDHPWPEADFKIHIDTDIVIGTGQPISGFLIIRAADDQAEILTITVDPKLRRSGLAGQLLLGGEAVSAKQGVDIMFLEVAEDNIAAIGLYKSLGYEAFGRRPAYYRRPNGRIAALTFRKRLTLDASPSDV